MTARRPGRNGGRTSANASGARCARTTAKNGNAWDYFTHDQARSRAYHWGEDGLAGISDDQQRLCFALALWNGKDPILKERLFGLTNSEGNHGEDVKEYYFYLDSTPTHSYMKYLYKYPQAAFPVRRSGRDQPRAQPAGVRVRADRHRRLRPGPLLRRVRRIRQGIARRHPGSDHRPQSRSGSGRAACAADTVVPQPVVVGQRQRRGRRLQACRQRLRRSGAVDADAGRALSSIAMARRRCCSPKTKPTRSGCSAARTGRPSSRTASTTTSSTDKPTR